MFSRNYDLSGVWDFTFQQAPFAEFCVTELSFDSSAAVPGCFDLLPGKFLKRGTGVYRRSVDNTGGMIALTLEGLGLRGKVYWDRELIAEIDCAFSQRVLRFDAGETGKHELIIAVNNEFDDSPSSMFFRNYDFYAHGGIYRKVYIDKIDGFDLEYLKILPIDPRAGVVSVELKLWGDTENCQEASATFDDNDQEVKCLLHDGAMKEVMQVPAPRLWSPESPNLHKIKIKVREKVFTAEFGLRSIEVKNGELFLNGNKLFLAGVNRHDAHPDFGYAIPQSIQVQDVLMLKAAGFNCIRGCHYPQSNDFLSLCDRVGMLVWEESLAWGNVESSMTDELFQKRQLQETRAMALKSINHPCVIMWGFLNECSSNLPSARELIRSLSEMLHHTDPTRPVTYASHQLTADCCLDLIDVISFNTYPGWYREGVDQFFDPATVKSHLEELEKFASDEKYKDKALLISEIGAEAMPGLRGGQRWSEDYQADLLVYVMQYVKNSPRWSGALLWQYCDSRTYISNASQFRPAGFNFKGIVDSHRQAKEAWRRLTTLLGGEENRK